VDVSSLGATLGDILRKTEAVLEAEQPDAFLVLGDTNSALSLIMAKRKRIPTYHMEAGNRCFDANVPEETNRRLVDHTADFNLAYTEHARRNLLAEGLQPRRVIVTGSPMTEVLEAHRGVIEGSAALTELGVEPGRYFLVSAHREENVDSPARLTALLECLNGVAAQWGLPVLVSTHPRTRRRLEALEGTPVDDLVRFHEPFGFLDYNRLQMSAACVLSDSGTIAEESTILGFPAVTLRSSIERPELAIRPLVGWSGGLFDRGVAGAWPGAAAFGASGAGSAGFWWTGWGAQCGGGAPKPSSDAGGGEPAGFEPAFPGQSLVFDQAAGQAQLGVGGEDDPGPEVGLFGGAQTWCGPAQGVLEEPEGVFDVEAA